MPVRWDETFVNSFNSGYDEARRARLDRERLAQQDKQYWADQEAKAIESDKADELRRAQLAEVTQKREQSGKEFNIMLPLKTQEASGLARLRGAEATKAEVEAREAPGLAQSRKELNASAVAKGQQDLLRSQTETEARQLYGLASQLETEKGDVTAIVKKNGLLSKLDKDAVSAYVVGDQLVTVTKDGKGHAMGIAGLKQLLEPQLPAGTLAAEMGLQRAQIAANAKAQKVTPAAAEAALADMNMFFNVDMYNKKDNRGGLLSARQRTAIGERLAAGEEPSKVAADYRVKPRYSPAVLAKREATLSEAQADVDEAQKAVEKTGTALGRWALGTKPAPEEKATLAAAIAVRDSAQDDVDEINALKEQYPEIMRGFGFKVKLNRAAGETGLASVAPDQGTLAQAPVQPPPAPAQASGLSAVAPVQPGVPTPAVQAAAQGLPLPGDTNRDGVLSQEEINIAMTKADNAINGVDDMGNPKAYSAAVVQGAKIFIAEHGKKLAAESQRALGTAR